VIHLRPPVSGQSRGPEYGASQVCRANYRSILSRPRAVSKGATNVTNRPKPAPFDTRPTAFRATHCARNSNLSLRGVEGRSNLQRQHGIASLRSQ
jgi:hypothetical protein